jgi:hypothetical protein
LRQNLPFTQRTAHPRQPPRTVLPWRTFAEGVDVFENLTVPQFIVRTFWRMENIQDKKGHRYLPASGKSSGC